MVDIRNTLREPGVKLRAYMSDALFKLNVGLSRFHSVYIFLQNKIMSSLWFLQKEWAAVLPLA
ncbi:hypothetical protein NBRC3279_1489 [Acetobacter pasteurianus NBRC 3279]|uniref:Uncharacterized protein n=2 Tax=Acetobacter pasteurianus TaxID=438 RepID=A0AAC9X1Y1_ACEPA|nr:hypothetical protein S101468_02501 [Acetobacter pasteurianus subsp. pasteurianus]GCD65998.1 hypothetical protein NBRC3279_1489 [Acetobacter pasteurianus NBRC 3279]GCD72307.1 hypothetical protein NBRC3284_1463 [Acetobacter pasteurianus NBRC 3284]